MNTISIHIISVISRTLNAYVYIVIVYGQVGLIVTTSKYMKHFVYDIRYHLIKYKTITEMEMKKLLINIIEFQLAVRR